MMHFGRDHKSANAVASDQMALSDPVGEARACRNLWCAVLEMVLRDLNSVGKGRYARQDRASAVRFIGTRDFREICNLAGLDPQSAEERIRAKIAAGEPFQLGRMDYRVPQDEVAHRGF